MALAARCLAAPHPELDAETAYIVGLLHDIGRQEGVTGMRHALDGYTFLHDLGYEDTARICLTHSHPLQNIHAIFGTWDCTGRELEFAEHYLLIALPKGIETVVR